MNAVAELEQELFSGESDAAFFLSEDQLAKRYTADQAQAVSWKREAVCMLVAAGWPIQDIATRLHMNTRTVIALAGVHASKVAGDKKTFGKILHGLGARWFGLAQAREGEAEFRDLVIAGGIATQRGSEVLAMGESGGENVLEMEAEQSAARAKLLAWIEPASATIDTQSPANTDGKAGFVGVPAAPSASAAGRDAVAASPVPDQSGGREREGASGGGRGGVVRVPCAQ